MSWLIEKEFDDSWEHVVARISRIDEVGQSDEPLRSRVSVELDAVAVTEEALAFQSYTIDDLDRLGWGVRVLRVVTNVARFASFVGPLQVGAWFLLRLGSNRPTSGMNVQQSPLGAGGFTRLEVRWIIASQFLQDDEGLQIKTPQRYGTPEHLFYMAQDIAGTGRVLHGLAQDADSVRAIISNIKEIEQIVVRDVGQASYIALLGSDRRAKLYYDVGWPLPFNNRTAPLRFVPDPERRPVILSHWDWDHLHAALKFSPHYMQAPWIVPDQKLGPGAARIARGLHEKGLLHVLRDANLSVGNLTLASCTGEVDDSNNSGLSLRVRLASGFTALLVGDADYMSLPRAVNDPVDGLVATHHCGRFKGEQQTLPRPVEGRTRFIASFGRGNVYKHPDSDALAAHRSAGWRRMDSTAGHGRAEPRGDRYFP